MAYKIGAGDFDQLLVIEMPMDAPDGFGGAVVTWVTFTTLWARVSVKSAREDERQGAQRQNCLYEIESWRKNLAAVTSAMRVNWRGTYLNIREIRLPPETSMAMQITAESGATT
jgi:SPP1 family predicted phage head-tail adaptor